MTPHCSPTTNHLHWDRSAQKPWPRTSSQALLVGKGLIPRLPWRRYILGVQWPPAAAAGTPMASSPIAAGLLLAARPQQVWAAFFLALHSQPVSSSKPRSTSHCLPPRPACCPCGCLCCSFAFLLVRGTGETCMCSVLWVHRDQAPHQVLA